MPETVTATYRSLGAAVNAADDLISTGIPSETVYVDKDALQVKVITPKSTTREIEEILRRHDPEDLNERTMA